MVTMPVLNLVIVSCWTLAACAGYTSYNSAKHLCCNGTVVVRAPHVECCGASAYDVRAFVCCGGRSLHPLPVGGNATTYDCCFVDGGTAALYDFTVQQCCDGAVLSKPEPDVLYGCCQGALFAPAEQHCCGGRVVERLANEDCCGATVYSLRNQTCCEQWSGINGKLVRTSVTVFDHHGGATQCCGTVGLHDPSVSICCQGAVVPLPSSASSGDTVDCCQGAPYDVMLETCCETFALRDGKWSTDHRIQDVADGLCCGLDIYDFRSEVCCGETVHARPGGATGVVCCGERLLTDPAAEACHRGVVVARNGSEVHQCRGRPYYTDTHACCNGRVVALESEVEECCWDAKRAYRKDKEMCCGAEVVPINDLDQTAGNDSCCTQEIH